MHTLDQGKHAHYRGSYLQTMNDSFVTSDRGVPAPNIYAYWISCRGPLGTSSSVNLSCTCPDIVVLYPIHCVVALSPFAEPCCGNGGY